MKNRHYSCSNPEGFGSVRLKLILVNPASQKQHPCNKYQQYLKVRVNDKIPRMSCSLEFPLIDKIGRLLLQQPCFTTLNDLLIWHRESVLSFL